MFVHLQTIIGMAEEGGYCIPAFNVYNTEPIMGVIAAGIGYWGSISLYEKLLSRMLRGELAVFDQSFTAISTGDGSVEEVMEYLVQSPEVFMEIIGLQFIFVAVVFIVSSIFFALRKHSNRV